MINKPQWKAYTFSHEKLAAPDGYLGYWNNQIDAVKAAEGALSTDRKINKVHITNNYLTDGVDKLVQVGTIDGLGEITWIYQPEYKFLDPLAADNA